jgi:hypothetical protein
MSFKIAIRKNATGEVRVYELEGCDWNDHSLFWLSRGQGNFGCDCNRELEFARAGGPGPGDDPDWNDLQTECGHERFDILYAEMPDGCQVKVDDPSNPYWEERLTG